MTAAPADLPASAAPASRNAICACGSGKRYKYCCGALTARSPESGAAASPPSAIPIGTTMNLALAAQKRGDLEPAAKLYRQVLQVEPQNIDALHMLGVIHFTRGDLDEAERLIRYADGLCPAPIPMIQHNLMMLREKIAASDRPTEAVAAIHVDASDSPISRVEEVCGAQEITLPALVPYLEIGSTGVSGTSEQKALFPPIRTFMLEQAVVDAESAIPATATCLVCDDHVDLSRHQSPEWRYGLYRRGAAGNGVLRTRCVDSFTHAELPAAIVLTSGYWINWAHFLTEVLPKALIAERRAQWRDWPMLISSSRLANAEELLRLLVAPDRRIVKAYGRMRIGEAGYVSSVGFCPLEYVYDAETGFPDIRPADCAFSPYALEMVRAAATRLAPPATNPASRYLYLRRNSKIRHFINQDEVEREFSARGFEIVAPENLSVMRQMELFSQARVIAGPTGAALANLVFAPPGCRVLILAAMTRHSAFHYWLNMAQATGHRAQYVFGRAVGPSAHPAHPDLHFDDLPGLGRIIDAVIREERRS